MTSESDVSTENAEDRPVDAELPNFSELKASAESDSDENLSPFLQVTVEVWGELGRVTMPLGELLRMNAGSVVELDRPVSAPVDVMAQGVCFARGEVVVVEDHFAIRIKEIEKQGQREIA